MAGREPERPVRRGCRGGPAAAGPAGGLACRPASADSRSREFLELAGKRASLREGQEVRRFAGAALASGFAICALVPLTILAGAAGASAIRSAHNGTYGVFDYQPPLGLDAALIHHLAGVVPRFRAAMERG
jgi:hypothetical protein